MQELVDIHGTDGDNGVNLYFGGYGDDGAEWCWMILIVQLMVMVYCSGDDCKHGGGQDWLSHLMHKFRVVCRPDICH